MFVTEQNRAGPFTVSFNLQGVPVVSFRFPKSAVPVVRKQTGNKGGKTFS